MGCFINIYAALAVGFALGVLTISVLASRRK